MVQRRPWINWRRACVRLLRFCPGISKSCRFWRIDWMRQDEFVVVGSAKPYRVCSSAWSVLLRNLWPMLAVGALFFGIALAKTRKSLDA